jgi:hypothetical protein
MKIMLAILISILLLITGCSAVVISTDDLPVNELSEASPISSQNEIEEAENSEQVFIEETEKTTEEVVDNHVKLYNDSDLEGFLSTFHDDVKLYSFSASNGSILAYDGMEAIREVYSSLFQIYDFHAEIINRILIGNKVILHVFITSNTELGDFEIAVVYEVENGLIKALWFIVDYEQISIEEAEKTPEEVVENQIQYYNDSDLEGFLSTFHDDAKAYALSRAFGSVRSFNGIEQIRNTYSSLFRSDNFHAEVLNRIVIGNTVICHELTTINTVFEIVKVYEVENGLMTALWFIRE